MFNKISYNRNAYDRNTLNNGMAILMHSSGNLAMGLVVQTPLAVLPMAGSGGLSGELTIKTPLNASFSGTSELTNTGIVLVQAMTAKLTSSGTMKNDAIFGTSMGASIGGTSGMVSDKDYVCQHMKGNLIGQGSIDARFVVKTNMYDVKFSGSGKFETDFILQLPLTIKMGGKGDFALRRLHNLNEDTFELIGINILPGEEIIIDTDLLDVIINHVRDVHSVTDDSVFFELHPGENELEFNTNISGQNIKVTAVWQNRWL